MTPRAPGDWVRRRPLPVLGGSEDDPLPLWRAPANPPSLELLSSRSVSWNVCVRRSGHCPQDPEGTHLPGRPQLLRPQPAALVGVDAVKDRRRPRPSAAGAAHLGPRSCGDLEGFARQLQAEAARVRSLAAAGALSLLCFSCYGLYGKDLAGCACCCVMSPDDHSPKLSQALHLLLATCCRRPLHQGQAGTDRASSSPHLLLHLHPAPSQGRLTCSARLQVVAATSGCSALLSSHRGWAVHGDVCASGFAAQPSSR